MKFSKLLSLTVISVLTAAIAPAQNCIQIKSILVDACGTPEGANEMVRFDVGNTALNTSGILVDWPNNSYNGLCKNAGTALKTDSLNQTVQGCGLLLEPVGGVLPAGAKVLLLTSEDISATSNSFASLNDTLIVIYQCGGNTAGHFANYNPTPGLRTLVISFNGGSCIDSVTYDRSLLVNQLGLQGGPSAYNDGAFVLFDAQGNATPLNNGCQALVDPLVANGGYDQIYCGNPLFLFGTVSGNVTTYQWNSTSGTFTDSSNLQTWFSPSPGLTGTIYAMLSATGACNTSSYDSVKIYMPVAGLQPILSANGSVLTCSLQSYNYTYNWTLNGAAIVGTSPFYTATQSGCYQVTVTDVNNCSVASDTVCIMNAAVSNLIGQQDLSVSSSNDDDELLIHLQAANTLNNVEINIINLNGQIVFSKSSNTNSNVLDEKINTVGLSNQLYVLQIKTKNAVKNLPLHLIK